jgi:hypothetical protein
VESTESIPACGGECAPGATGARASSVQVIDLDDTGQPNVVVDLYTGGAHCGSVAQVFTGGVHV